MDTDSIRKETIKKTEKEVGNKLDDITCALRSINISSAKEIIYMFRQEFDGKDFYSEFTDFERKLFDISDIVYYSHNLGCSLSFNIIPFNPDSIKAFTDLMIYKLTSRKGLCKI